jgi:hypothetical protein
MKPVSVYFPEKPYVELKSIAARRGRPVAELIREAMSEYLARERQGARSVLEIPAHPSGQLRRRWTRGELIDEMRAR